jgi:hypothetical protein
MSNTGSYRYDKTTGQVVKVSDRIPVLKYIAPWKREMNPTTEVARANDAAGDRKLREIYSKD